MAILKARIAEAKWDALEEHGFTRVEYKKCNCEVKPYEHTHDSNHGEWQIEIEDEYFTFEEEQCQ